MNQYQKIQRQILQESINKYQEKFDNENKMNAVKAKASERELTDKYSYLAEAALSQRARINESTRFNTWSNDVKENLLFEFIMNIYDKCTNKILNESSGYSNLKCNLIQNFIKDTGASTLLNEFKRASNFLSEAALVIESAHKKIISNVDPKDKEYVIDTLIKKNVFDKINMANVDGICNSICSKVKDSIEDFVATNNENRIKISEVLKQAKNKIEGSKDDSIKESVNRISNVKIKAIENAPTNIFGEMVVNMCNNMYKIPVNERASITQSDGKLNMEYIVESCKCIYTFLEMLNTSRMHSFTNKELVDIITNIGKRYIYIA